MLIVLTETSDVFLEAVSEEEVSRDFYSQFTTRAESDESDLDTSRLLSRRYNTLRYFTFQHLR